MSEIPSDRPLSALERLVPARLRKAVAGRVIARLRAGFARDLAAMPRRELEPRHIAHLVPLVDREALLDRLPKGGRVAEIGVAAGDFSAEILARCAPERLDLVDAWASDRYSDDLMESVRARFEAEIAAGQVALHRGLSTVVGAELPEGAYDWIYIDTDHSYATTRDELRLFSQKLKPGGMLAGHDYTQGSWESLVLYGVIPAVHAFCVDEGWELLHVTLEQRVPPSFALRRLTP